MNLEKMGKAAKEAAKKMAQASSEQKNTALRAIIEVAKKREKEILLENQKDIIKAKTLGLEEAMLERLSLQNRLRTIFSDLEKIIDLPDPVSECFEEKSVGDLQIKKQRTPLGVLGVIYESRPNVTIDISALAIKSGNCAILRGGSESLHTNTILIEVIQEALTLAKIPTHAIQMILDTDRSSIKKMLKLHKYIDLIIPRGGAALQKFCLDAGKIPVITGGVGICHIFVDKSANLEKSLRVILNAKTQRPTVCNALDTLLIHEEISDIFTTKVIHLLSTQGVKFHLDAKGMQIAQGENNCLAALLHDWDTEWLGLHLGIKVVKNLEEAILHITYHSTGHSDAILTENKENADLFIAHIDSAAVYVNASTRFTDGGQLGLGAEVAISTQKLHARGPMGLRELTSYKWVISGDYAIRN
ncbi:MAG: glutamate-5-semialdehyde dehydrogenase [Chlamydiota bacterium]